MRVGIAGFMHESNTFASSKTTLRHFHEAFYHRGPALIPVWEEAHHELGGFIAGCCETGMEIVPLLAAWATPHGAVTDEAYEAVLDDLLGMLRAAGPLDGLLLALHGAMVADSLPSADSETLRRIREVVGPLPLVLSLDMHANIAPEMAALPDATVAYRTYPHIDQCERGMECARLLHRMLRGEVHPVQAHLKLPLLIHIVQQYTGSGPMAEIFAELERICLEPGILSASIAPGYIYADSPHMGTSVIVVADGEVKRAEAMANKLAHCILDRRQALNDALPGVPAAVAQAKTIPGPVCLMDAGDNIGAGSPGDSTVIFAELLRQEVHPACVVLHDPEAAAECARIGLGAPFDRPVGAKSGPPHGAPVPITGTVRFLGDGRFVEPAPRHGGMRDNDQGPTAVVETAQGDLVVLNSLRVMPTSLHQLLSLGIDPAQMKAMVVKGVTAPRAAYEPVAAAVIPVDSPGVSQAGPESFTYHRRPRPLYPLEQALDMYPPGEGLGAPDSS